MTFLELWKVFAATTTNGLLAGYWYGYRRGPAGCPTDPVHGNAWVTWERARRIFDYPTDPTWADDRLEVGADELRDPWPA